jgi:hypothetical protein
MSASLKPNLIRPFGSQQKKVRSFSVPGLGRIAFSRDAGEAGLFSQHFLATRLRAIVTDPLGRIVEERDLGSGKVTNAGVLCLANDAVGWPVEASAPSNTFAWTKYHSWGIGTTAEKVEQLVLTTPSAPTATEAVAGTNILVTAANVQKLQSEAKIKAESNLAITEWGLTTEKILKSTTGTPATATTANTLTKAAAWTASTTAVAGQTKKVLRAEKTEKVFGIVTSNTTGVCTINGGGSSTWYKEADGTAGTTPEATTAFDFLAVLFDRRKFEPINVESGNEISFPWTLELKSGG